MESAPRQRGAALVGVLALLAVTLLLGVSAMRAALIDERMAGNYQQTVKLDMGAEWAVALALTEEQLSAASFVEAPVAQLADMMWQHFSQDNSSEGDCPGDIHCRYGYWLHGDTPYIAAMAWQASGDTVPMASLPVIAMLELVDDASPNGDSLQSRYRLVGWQ